MTSVGFTEEFMAGYAARRAAGEGPPVLVPEADVGEDPGWFSTETAEGWKAS